MLLADHFRLQVFRAQAFGERGVGLAGKQVGHGGCFLGFSDRHLSAYYIVY